MLGRKTYTHDEINNARFALAEQLTAYGTLVAEANGETAQAALADFEPLFFNNLVLVLDRFFVHRVRAVTGKDSNPLNEVELIAESLLTNNAVLRGNAVIKYVPANTVVRLEIGDDIRLTAAEFDRLSTAFLAEIEARMGVDTDA
ncbi:hypothetical protein [Cryobacterium arcticum]|uniref:Uncharacterized protein n=1 Tax=Cryobacterium arcticum TaxID=670052 RepID=A0A318A375_9MICO|nr:hypothetical protein [Cryobacterium arcticum]PXA72766.1 hypothetical protein CTB96_01285 [Cryobacterium arcticum]